MATFVIGGRAVVGGERRPTVTIRPVTVAPQPTPRVLQQQPEIHIKYETLPPAPLKPNPYEVHIKYETFPPAQPVETPRAIFVKNSAPDVRPS